MRSRRKGVRFEREVAAVFREELGASTARSLEESRGGVGDVLVALPTEPPIRLLVQCKVGQRPNAFTALQEAARDAKLLEAGDERHPVLPVAAVHRDHGETLVALRIGDFTTLIRRLVRASVREAA